MAGGRLGTIFVELNIDDKVFKQKLSEQLRSTETTAKGIEQVWKILGTKSDAMFDDERRAYENAMTLIKASHKSTTDDILRAEKIVHDQIRRLNEEQYGKEEELNRKRTAISRDSQAGWISMMKGMLAYRAIMYGMQLAWDATVGSVIKGIEKINEFQISQASMAAAIASRSNFKGTFEEAHNLAGKLNEELEVMDRQFIGTADELRVLTDAMLTYGMTIDFSNEKAKNQFVAFANVIKLLTRGQDFQRQAMQEVRSLMAGENVQGAMLVKKIEAAGYEAKKMIPLWQEQGILLDKILEIMKGYEKSGSTIEKTLTAQKGTLETIVNKILREGMKPLYDDILEVLKYINDSLLGMNGLTERSKVIVEDLHKTYAALKLTLIAIKEIIFAIPEGLLSIERITNKIRTGIAETDDEFMRRTTGLSKWENYLQSIANLWDVIRGKKDWKTGQLLGYGEQGPWGDAGFGRDRMALVIPGEPRKKTDEEAEKERIRLIKLEADLMEKQIDAREKWAEEEIKAVKAATEAMEKFMDKGLTGVSKKLEEIDKATESVNAKLREQYGITAETITVDQRYVASLNQILLKREQLRAQAIEAEIQEQIAHDKRLKSIDDELRASLDAETNYEDIRDKKLQYDAQDAFDAAVREKNYEIAQRILMEGLADEMRLREESHQKLQTYMDYYNIAYRGMEGTMADLMNTTINAFASMEDAIVNFIMTGKNSFRDFANAVISDIMRIYTRQALIQPLMQALGYAFGISPVGTGGTTSIAGGGYTGTIGGPTVFTRASGGPVFSGTPYLVGERGPELFVPSTAGTVVPGGGKGGNVTVNVKNESGQPVQAKSSKASIDAQGWVIDIVLDGLNRNVRGLRTALGGA